MLTHHSSALDSPFGDTRRVAGANVPFGDTSSASQCNPCHFAKGCPTAYRSATLPLDSIPAPSFEDKNIEFEDKIIHSAGPKVTLKFRAEGNCS